jgi:hypothetical protein
MKAAYRRKVGLSMKQSISFLIAELLNGAEPENWENGNQEKGTH